jgi:hypothetical protein
MIDLVQALELFEICADEMTREESSGEYSAGAIGHRRMSLTARALAKRQLHVAHLARFPLRGGPRDGAGSDRPAMTLGAMIVFRTADRFVRAGASTDRTLDAIYRAAQQYVEIIPSALQDGVDKTAICGLMTEGGQPMRLGRCARAAGSDGHTCVLRPDAFDLGPSQTEDTAVGCVARG